MDQSESLPVMNGDGAENVIKSTSSPSPMSPVSPEAGSDSHSSDGHDESSSPSAFVRNAARKSLGDGLSMQKWFSAHERVLERQQSEPVSPW